MSRLSPRLLISRAAQVLLLVGLFSAGSTAVARAGEPAPYTPPAKSPRYIFPIAQFVIGALLPQSPQELPPGLAVQVQGGALIGWPGRNTLERLFVGTLWLRPELSYEYRRFDPTAGTTPPPGEYDHRQGHLVSLGMGAGYGNLMFLIGMYSARFVVGGVQNKASEGEVVFNPAVGMRHGLSLMFLGTLFSFNVEHQLLSLRDVLRHELLVTVGINLTMPAMSRLL